MKNTIKISVALWLLWVTISQSAYAQSTTPTQSKVSDKLFIEFLNPPNEAKPRIWWHWMNGNITKDGIAKDLKWMKRAGIGGFMNFDAAMMTPQVVDKRLTYMTPEWKDAFRFTTKLADSLKLEMAIAGSPGWSESGGPWVKPEDGMKKIVWTEIRVKGGTSNIKIPQPSGVTGPFQNLSKQPEFGEPVEQSKLPLFYKDVAVVAFKLPEADKSLSELGAVVTSSGGNFTLAQLTDGDLGTTNLLPRDSAIGFAWIQFTFTQPQTIKAITMVGGGKPGLFGLGADPIDSRALEASDDCVNFKLVCYILPGAVLQQTIAIPEIKAKYFRVKVQNPLPVINDMAAMTGLNTAKVIPSGTEIAEIVLHPSARINMYEEKDAFAPATELYKKASEATNDVVALNDIIDLTGKLNANGSLNWTAPAGEWKVVRFGYSLLGIQNHPASPEATGLEVDKLDPMAIRNYFNTYLDQYKNATDGLIGNNGGLQYMVTDSWEAGAQNWTDNMPIEFQKRRGYSMIPWLPVLTGQVVKSAEASEQFLWDFRKTLSDMVAEYHYDGLTKILAEHGMKRYSESHENGRTFIADGMEVKRTAAIPMSAMWTPGGIGGGDEMHIADIRESASVAHIYGQNLVAAESFTAFGLGGNAWSYDPQKLKPTADLELASGLNRFVIHTSVHQPIDNKIPGLGLGPFGQWFNRHETWAEQADVWTTYLARSSQLLQKGKIVANVIYYYGEDNNITSLFGTKSPNIPEGYNFDYVNADALVNMFTVKDHQLVTPGDMHYNLLALDSNSMQMTLEVARKIKELVTEGAYVVGPKPTKSPDLMDDQSTFKSIVNELWGDNNNVKTIGKGKVFPGKDIKQVLNAMKISPDFEYTTPKGTETILYVHRKLPAQDLYWVNNRSNQEVNIEGIFNVSGKTVEIWHPDTGQKEESSYSFDERRTKVPLHLMPNDAVFVVFNKSTTIAKRTIPQPIEKQLSILNGDWNLSFQKDRGAPSQISLTKLSSWSENEVSGIKYFSGTGTYSKTIIAMKSWFTKGNQFWIDLGDVKNLAEVLVNGRSLGIVWKKPFRINATNAFKPGNNLLEIKVTNIWVNRLIGDEQPGIEKKITFTTMPFYNANSPLLQSGLLGPVQLLQISN